MANDSDNELNGIYAMVQSNFNAINAQLKTIIDNQADLYSKVHNLEKADIKQEQILEEVTKVQSIQYDKDITFLLWFSEKKKRLLLALVPIYLFSIDGVRHLVMDWLLKIIN